MAKLIMTQKEFNTLKQTEEFKNLKEHDLLFGMEIIIPKSIIESEE